MNRPVSPNGHLTAGRPPFRRFALLNALLLALLALGALLVEAVLAEPLRTAALLALLASVGAGQFYLLYARYG